MGLLRHAWTATHTFCDIADLSWEYNEHYEPYTTLLVYHNFLSPALVHVFAHSVCSSTAISISKHPRASLILSVRSSLHSLRHVLRRFSCLLPAQCSPSFCFAGLVAWSLYRRSTPARLCRVRPLAPNLCTATLTWPKWLSVLQRSSCRWHLVPESGPFPRSLRLQMRHYVCFHSW
jgi:hypothetical protein